MASGQNVRTLKGKLVIVNNRYIGTCVIDLEFKVKEVDILPLLTSFGITFLLYKISCNP